MGVLAALFLEGDDLLALAVLEDLALDRGALDQRRAQLGRCRRPASGLRPRSAWSRHRPPGFPPSGPSPWPPYTVFRRCGRPRTWSNSLKMKWFSGNTQFPESGAIYGKALPVKPRIARFSGGPRSGGNRRPGLGFAHAQLGHQGGDQKHHTHGHRHGLGVGDAEGDPRHPVCRRPSAAW